jgi:hypothetical protein
MLSFAIAAGRLFREEQHGSQGICLPALKRAPNSPAGIGLLNKYP